MPISSLYRTIRNIQLLETEGAQRKLNHLLTFLIFSYGLYVFAQLAEIIVLFVWQMVILDLTNRCSAVSRFGSHTTFQLGCVTV